MAKNLLIAEKDSQAELLAKTLGMNENRYDILVPTKEIAKVETKIASLEKRITKKESDVDAIIGDAYAKGKDHATLKKYQVQAKKLEDYKAKLADLKNDYEEQKRALAKKSVTYWESDENVLVSCTGHLIDIKKKKKSPVVKTVEPEEETDEENVEEKEFESDEESDLNFEVEYSAPSATSEDTQSKWLKFKLVEHMLKNADIDKIYCATDFDREGQSIFGTLMEYFNIDFDRCLRMKFSSLEDSVLREAYENPIEFDTKMFEAGKMRRWMDFVIGFNLNPTFAKIYRHTIKRYLSSLKIDEKIIDQVKYNNTFNMGRVKLVILKYIFDHTKNEVENASKIKNDKMRTSETKKYSLYIKDNSKMSIHLHSIDEDDDLLSKIKMDRPLKVKIIDVVEKEGEMKSTRIPSFLNLTKVFEECKELGASTQEINRILEYLYLQKYISYPRSKSEKWELDNEDERTEYAHSVLDALKSIGYPVEDYYYDGYGNEGDESHSHPCIHPLPSVDQERVERLKRLNPLAFMVFNQIAIYTLKCFEKNPIAKTRDVTYLLNQDGVEIGRYRISNVLEIVEPRILNYIGYYQSTQSYKINVKPGEEFDVDVKVFQVKNESLISNKSSVSLLNDFDVIRFLNEEDIGTDATRAPLLAELIELQYLFSQNVLLTTFLGNTMQKLAENYVDFINTEYTRRIERKLNDIENGSESTEEFVDYVKEIIKTTYSDIIDHNEEIQDIFMETPQCEQHQTQMVIKAGAFGKYLLCPHSFTDEHCKQRASF